MVSLTCGSSESVRVVVDLLFFLHKTFVIHINITANRFNYQTLWSIVVLHYIISVMSKPVAVKIKLYEKTKIPVKICL